MKITVLGSGGWGTALALLIHSNLQTDDSLVMWDFLPEILNNIKNYRENKDFLPDVNIPNDIDIEYDIDKAIENSDIIFSVVPAKGVHFVLEHIADLNINKIEGIVSTTKGFDLKEKKRISKLWEEKIGDIIYDKYVVLSGPSYAKEVAAKKITAVTLASKNHSLSQKVASFLSNNYFRCYSSDDIIGVELGGALKNIMAIGAGIIDQLQLGNNARAAFITRALYEMIRFGRTEGAKRETFFGLSGIGDLVVTSTSSLSRNHTVGEELAKGRKLDDIISSMKMVAEGVKTTEIVNELGKKRDLDLPITYLLYNIMYKDLDVKEGIVKLMSRSLKDEQFY